MIEGIIIGLHLATAHFDAAPRSDLRGFNLGIYARAPGGFTVGAYSNSHARLSVYGGWTFETADRRFAITAGAVSGYRLGAPPRPRILPLVVPSVRLGDDDASLRLSLLPKASKHSAAGLHFSIERKF